MSIPDRKFFNNVKSRHYAFLGNKYLTKLKESLKFQNLPSGHDSKLMADGTIIEVSYSYGEGKIKIKSPSRRLLRKLKQSCLCLPHFSIGIIVSVYPKEVTEQEMFSQRFWYDILICRGNSYVLGKNIYDANYGRYYEGMLVLVTVGAEMPEWEEPLDCDRNCLLDELRFSYMSVSPISIIGKMRKWNYDAI